MSRRSGHLHLRPPHRHPLRLGLLCEVLADAVAGEDDDGAGGEVEHLVVASEGSGTSVGGEVGLADDLRDVALACPDGGDAIHAAGEAAVEDDDLPEAVEGAVERGIDGGGVREVRPSGDDDAGTFRGEFIGLLLSHGAQVIAGLDDGGGDGVALDAACAGEPG